MSAFGNRANVQVAAGFAYGPFIVNEAPFTVSIALMLQWCQFNSVV